MPFLNCDYNSFRDETIPWDYQGIEHSCEQKPWIMEQKNPRILVTGAKGWLGHYLLHILSYPQKIADILSLDLLQKPEYLEQKRYEAIQYHSLVRKSKDLDEAIVSFRPQIIFHCDYVWPLGQETKSHIYEINARQTERVCQAAIKADVKRIVCFSDFSLYDTGNKVSSEEDCLNPVSEMGKSFQMAEEIAASYHQKRGLEVYHLRLAPLYGALIPCGIMVLGKLMADGMVLGPLQNMPHRISVLNARDMSLAALNFLLLPALDHRVFNLASETIETKSMLSVLSEILPKKKILGFETRIAHIMKIGYQEKIQIPQSWCKTVASFFEETHGFFNILRAEKRIPALREQTLDYLFSWKELCFERMQNSLGIKPSPSLLRESIQYAVKEGWKIQETAKREGMEERYTVLGGIQKMVEAYSAFSIEEETECLFLDVPLLDLSIDTKSLWILLERISHFFWVSLLQGKGAGGSKDWISFFPDLGKSILELIQYENQRAGYLFPGSKQERVKWLVQKMGGLNGTQIRHYANMLLLKEILYFFHKVILEYSHLVQLLPDKNYGIFLASEIGDLGIVLKIKEGKASISFPRQEIDSISRSWFFPKRLSEFQKICRLHIALGARMEKFFSDLSSVSFFKAFRKGFGKEYLISDGSQHYTMIAKAMRKSNVNIYIFLDQENKAAFGFTLKNKKIFMVSSLYLGMINQMIEEIQDYGEIIQLLSKASAGKEEVAFFRIQTVRKLLSGVIAPSRIRKLVFKLMERAAGL
ncbi:MAG: NAD(P)-dependent oxidoreductase [Candidatus Brocadiae bacterium]|nr:NAD(P)-dependent oxidoreductase [Candidatus Brocadiia bacterium]